MKTVIGTVQFVDLETGVWLLKSDEGESFLLAGGDRNIKRHGARIEAVGSVDETAISLQMVGPKLTVSKYRFL